MSSLDAKKKRELAEGHTLEHLYPDFDEVDIVEMKNQGGDTLIGVAAKRHTLVGKETKHGYLLIDNNETVNLANKCSRSRMYEQLGRNTDNPSLAERIESIEEDLNALRRIGEEVNRILFGKKKRTSPAQCPKCEDGPKRSIFSLKEPMKEISEGVYQCRKNGHIVRLDADDVHVHED